MRVAGVLGWLLPLRATRRLLGLLREELGLIGRTSESVARQRRSGCRCVRLHPAVPPATTPAQEPGFSVAQKDAAGLSLPASPPSRGLTCDWGLKGDAPTAVVLKKDTIKNNSQKCTQRRVAAPVKGRELQRLQSSQRSPTLLFSKARSSRFCGAAETPEL